LEHYASTSALVRRYAERKGIAPEETNGKEIVARYHEGETEAIHTIEEHWEWLGQGIRSFINIFAPQKVVIGGGISEAGEFYFEGIRRHTAANMMEVCGAHTEIVAATLGNRAGSLGAAGLILQQ
jgi:glucokinase